MKAFGQPTLLYDGACSFCTEVVARLCHWDRKGTILALPAASAEGAHLLESLTDPADPSVTVILVAQGRTLLRSEAVLEALVLLGGWRGTVARIGKLVPRTWRDRVYDLVALNRHRLPGSKGACRLP